jgi:predicted AAA+ superfamily ATPase
MYPRNIDARVRAALADTRVVLVNGARQTGKSTLAQRIATDLGGRYLSLDDAALLGAARSDPKSLLSETAPVTVIDEVQRAPGLFPAIKQAVDRDRRPGQFLLTGSADIFLTPRISESLAGRIEILTLQPLSQDELAGRHGIFPDRLFAGNAWQEPPHIADRISICRSIVRGGFPEAIARSDNERRAVWYRNYVSTLLQRDVRDLANIEGLTDLPRLLGLLAARSSALLNMSELSRSTTIAHTTMRRYLSLLEATFVLQPLPPWASNAGKRFVKSPKIHLIDTGLTTSLRGESEPRDLAHSHSLGPLLESFVVQELRKQLGWSRQSAIPYHFRTASGLEVDVVLEAPGGNLVGIEVKASSSVGRGDFAGLDALAEIAGKRFVAGVVLYLGEHAIRFGDRWWALPVGTIWQGTA